MMTSNTGVRCKVTHEELSDGDKEQFIVAVKSQQ